MIDAIHNGRRALHSPIRNRCGTLVLIDQTCGAGSANGRRPPISARHACGCFSEGLLRARVQIMKPLFVLAVSIRRCTSHYYYCVILDDLK